MATDPDLSSPEFVFICGAVGSGNTFMFSSIIKDPHVYGLNEDGLGTTLHNLLGPGNDASCPHAIEEYAGFMHRLRRDRRTLVLKTPSNIRYSKSLREVLPSSRFIVMIREPHAAVVSGLTRHGDRYSIEDVARIWLSDYEHYDPNAEGILAITFDQLVSDPASTLHTVSEQILPLGPEVFTYATRVNQPDRSSPDRWRTRVDDGVRAEVERWVRELGLAEIYEAARGAPGAGALPAATQAQAPRTNTLAAAKKQFFRAWYRLKG